MKAVGISVLTGPKRRSAVRPHASRPGRPTAFITRSSVSESDSDTCKTDFPNVLI